MASDVGLTVLGAAVVCELLAYYIPWLDNLLDAIASPAAVIEDGLDVVLFGELDPVLRWSTSIIVGGTTSGTVQVSTVGIRALSTASTGGLGNPIVSTVEAGACLVCTVLALLLPVLAMVLVVAGLVVGGRWLLRRGANWERMRLLWCPSTLRLENGQLQKSIGGRQALTDASRLTVAKLKALCASRSAHKRAESGFGGAPA